MRMSGQRSAAGSLAPLRMKFEVECSGPWAAASLNPVAHILALGSKLQVLGIAACRVVAGVQHEHPLGDRSVRQFPGYPMGGSHAGSYAHAAVSAVVPIAHPHVTSRSPVDLHVGAQPLGDRPPNARPDRPLERPSAAAPQVMAAA